MIAPRSITADELARAIAQGEMTECWNVLTDDYFTGEMIPGSRRVPVDHVAREVKNTGLAPDTPIAVYCSGPACPQSGAAGEKLAMLGFTNVRVFEGGLPEWKESGRAVEPASSPVA